LLKHYFQLFRVSNIFTVPPDILAGYFITVSVKSGGANYNDLVILVFSSIFLYVGGLATNDLFDFDIDKNQRPNRPLPSGNIRKSTTAILSVLFLGAGLLLSLFVSITSTIVSSLLVVMILAYNYKLKNGVSRPFLMGGIRGLNVIYGSTSNYGFSLNANYFYGIDGIDYSIWVSLMIATLAVFIHIFTLTWISARETVEEMKKFKKLINLKNVYFRYLFLFGLIISTGIIFLPDKILFLSFFVVFLAAVSFIFYKKARKDRLETQDIVFIVKNMIVLLILLGASFVAGASGFYMGIITASLLVSCVIIGKRVQMT
jgi:4-hydroxybenzoate polyprenyltransferase